jgi:hypothetical protein
MTFELFQLPLAFIGGLGLLPSLFLSLGAASGVAGSFMQYRAGQAQADLAEDQAEVNAEMARREAEDQAREESEQARSMREQQRRRRDAMEAAYASSGVLLEGTPAAMLTRQRETDEYNVQQMHRSMGEQRKLMLWDADTGLQMGRARARGMRKSANIGLVTGLANTGANAYGNFKTWKG